MWYRESAKPKVYDPYEPEPFASEHADDDTLRFLDSDPDAKGDYFRHLTDPDLDGIGQRLAPVRGRRPSPYVYSPHSEIFYTHKGGFNPLGQPGAGGLYMGRDQINGTKDGFQLIQALKDHLKEHPGKKGLSMVNLELLQDQLEVQGNVHGLKEFHDILGTAIAHEKIHERYDQLPRSVIEMARPNTNKALGPAEEQLAWLGSGRHNQAFNLNSPRQFDPQQTARMSYFWMRDYLSDMAKRHGTDAVRHLMTEASPIAKRALIDAIKTLG